MRRDLLPMLCDPRTREPFDLVVIEANGDDIITGELVTPSGRRWPIRNRIPRFVEAEMFDGVKSFGDQWNHFNYDAFKKNWLEHTVANTFGGTHAFNGKLIVDCGGGSGAQSLWMLEAGAARVIMLELSHSVDDVLTRNIAPETWPNFDAIQCSIDAPPLKTAAINGIVICHNVIQHTPSVEGTALALYDIVAPSGEFVFNCYRAAKPGVMNFIKTHFTYGPLRKLFRKLPFSVLLGYCRVMGVLRLVPGIGKITNKLRLSLTGPVPREPGESWWTRQKKTYRQTVLNTFDMYGSHDFQHALTDKELQAILTKLQPNTSKIGNFSRYFERPTPSGMAFRVEKANYFVKIKQPQP